MAFANSAKKALKIITKTTQDLENGLEEMILESPEAGKEIQLIINYLKTKEKKIQNSLRLF